MKNPEYSLEDVMRFSTEVIREIDEKLEKMIRTGKVPVSCRNMFRTAVKAGSSYGEAMERSRAAGAGVTKEPTTTKHGEEEKVTEEPANPAPVASTVLH